MNWLTESTQKANWLTRPLSSNQAKISILPTKGEVFLSGSALVLSKSVFLSKRLAAVAFMILLAGCVTQEPEVRTVRVEVPVLVLCKTQDVAIPAWASAGLRKSDSLEVKVRALLAERRQRIGYERGLIAAVMACQ